jgi:hypothetical protein
MESAECTRIRTTVHISKSGQEKAVLKKRRGFGTRRQNREKEKRELGVVRPAWGAGREAGLGHASDDDPSNQLLGSSITYRIAVGPQKGRKVFTLQTLPDCESDAPLVSKTRQLFRRYSLTWESPQFYRLTNMVSFS